MILGLMRWHYPHGRLLATTPIMACARGRLPTRTALYAGWWCRFLPPSGFADPGTASREPAAGAHPNVCTMHD